MIAGLAATQLKISVRTIERWADQGKIRATRTTAGWRLFDPQDVARLARQLGKRARGR